MAWYDQRLSEQGRYGGFGLTRRGEVEEDKEFGVFDHVADIAMSPLRGVEGMVQDVWGLADTLTGDILPDYEQRFLGESQTVVGGISEGIFNFAAGFIPVAGWIGKGAKVGRTLTLAKGLSKEAQKAAAKAGARGLRGAKGTTVLGEAGIDVARAAVAGAVADFAVFDGHEARLSNLVQEFPQLANPVTEFLAADEEDSEIEGRLKAMVEGLGIGGIIDSFILSLKHFRGYKQARARGDSPKEAQQAADDKVSPQKLTASLESFRTSTYPKDPFSFARLVDDEDFIVTANIKEKGTYKGTLGIGGTSGLTKREQLDHIRNLVVLGAEQGSVGKEWYERSGQEILRLTGGNIDEADKIAQLVAVFSPQTGIEENFERALKAYYWAKRHNRTTFMREQNWINTGLMQEQAARILYDGEWLPDLVRKIGANGEHIARGDGRKISNFYNDIMSGIDPTRERVKGATMDMWMSRYFGFAPRKNSKGGAEWQVSNTQYDYMQRTVKSVAEELGWEQHQVQAAVWSYAKTLWDSMTDDVVAVATEQGLTKTKKGLFDLKTNHEYGELYLDMFQQRLNAEVGASQKYKAAESFDLSGLLRERSIVLPDTSLPSPGSGILEDLHHASWEEKVQYQADMELARVGDDGQDLIEEALGFGSRSGTGPGESRLLPGPAAKKGALKKRLESRKSKGDPSAIANAKAYAMVEGLYHGRAIVEGVQIFHGKDLTKTASNGFEVRFGRRRSDDDLEAIQNAVTSVFGRRKIVVVPMDAGFVLVSKTKGKAFVADAEKVMEALNLPKAEISGNHVFAEHFQLNSKTDDGSGFRAMLEEQGYDQALERLDDVYGPNVAKTQQKYEGKGYGGAPKSSRSGEAPQQRLVANSQDFGSRTARDRNASRLEDLDGNPVSLNEDGTVTLYHRTSKESAQRILDTGVFSSKENTQAVYFSNLEQGSAKGYGASVVSIKIDPAKVELDDAFHKGEVHVRVQPEDLADVQVVGAGRDLFTPEEIAIATKTARVWKTTTTSKAARRLAPSFMPEGGTILDFGAGKQTDPDKYYGKGLVEDGYEVTLYDFSENTGPMHNPEALGEQYDMVMASNVLNVQSSEDMLDITLDQIARSANKDGRVIANFPGTPRKGAFEGMSKTESAEFLREKLLDRFAKVELVGGTKAEPVFMASGKLAEPHTGARLHPKIEAAAPGIGALQDGLFRQGYDLLDPDDADLVVRLVQQRYGGEILESGTFTPELIKDLTKSAEFKKQFGKSKIVGKGGKPQVLYHGTPKQFKKFRSKGSGIWFARKADNATPGDGTGKGRLKAAYLRVEKPYKLTAAELKEFQKTSTPKKFIRELRTKLDDHDGLIVGDYAVVVFDDSQIIRASKTEGSFGTTRRWNRLPDGTEVDLNSSADGGNGWDPVPTEGEVRVLPDGALKHVEDEASALDARISADEKEATANLYVDKKELDNLLRDEQWKWDGEPVSKSGNGLDDAPDIFFSEDGGRMAFVELQRTNGDVDDAILSLLKEGGDEAEAGVRFLKRNRKRIQKAGEGPPDPREVAGLDPADLAKKKRGMEQIFQRIRLEQFKITHAGKSPSGNLSHYKTGTAAQELSDADIHILDKFMRAVGTEMFENVHLTIRKGPDGVLGQFDFLNDVVLIARRALQGGEFKETIFHELWHHLSRYVDDATVGKLRKQFEKERDAYFRKNPGEYAEFKRRNYTPETYRYANLDEYFAEVMKEKSLAKLEEMDAASKSLFVHAKKIFLEMIAAIKSKFGFDHTQKIVNDFMNGKVANASWSGPHKPGKGQPRSGIPGSSRHRAFGLEDADVAFSKKGRGRKGRRAKDDRRRRRQQAEPEDARVGLLRPLGLKEDVARIILRNVDMRLSEGYELGINPREKLSDGSFKYSKEDLLARHLERSDLNLSHYSGPEDAIAVLRTYEDLFRSVIETDVDALKRQSYEQQVQRGMDELATMVGTTTRDEQSLRLHMMSQIAEDEYQLARINARILAYKNVQQTMGKMILEDIKLYRNPDGNSDQAQAMIHAHAEFMANLTAGIKGLTALQGRGLGSGNIPIQGVLADPQQLESFLQMRGGRKGTDRLVQILETTLTDELLDAEGIGRLNRMLKPSFSRRVMNITNEYWINSILSGGKTLFINGLGGVMTSIYRPLESMLGASVTLNGAALTDATAELGYLFVHAKDAFKMAWQSFKSGENILDPKAKVLDLPNKDFEAISPRSFGMREDSFFGTGVTWLGNTLRLPSRILTSTDEFFKQVNYRAKAQRSLMREGMSIGLQGKDLAEHVHDRLSLMLDQGQAYSAATAYNRGVKAAHEAGLVDPVEIKEFALKHTHKSPAEGGFDHSLNTLSKAALEVAEEVTFTRALDPGSASAWLQRLVIQSPWMRFIVPFVRTPVNIAKTAGQRYDFIGLTRFLYAKMSGDHIHLKDAQNRMMRDLASGDPRKISDAAGRASAGAMAAIVLYSKASQGEMTGRGPSDPELRQILKDAGWQPYSIKTSEGYVSYARIDPFATVMGTMADLHDHIRYSDIEDQEEVSTALMGVAIALSQNFTNKTYLAGISNVLQALDQPDRFMPKLARTYAASMLPFSSFQGQSLYAFGDEYMRDVQSMTEALMAKTPYYSDQVRPLRNFLGEEVRRTTAAGTDSIGSVMDLFFPIAYTQFTDDKLKEEFVQLGHGFTPPKPRKAGLDLTSYLHPQTGQDAFDRWQQLNGEVTIGGRSLRSSLLRLISSTKYQRLTPLSDFKAQSPRIAEIKKILERYKAKAFDQVLKEYPQLAVDHAEIFNVRNLRKRGIIAGGR